MNKIAKGAVAGGIGVALLLGGAGTLAYWTDSANVGGATTIAAGNLKVATSGTASWSVTNHGTTTAVADIASYTMVPGDELTFTQPVTITAVGTNLKAKATLGTGAITPLVTGDTEDEALATALGSSADVEIDGAAELDNITATGTYDVTATISWDFGAAGEGNTARLGKVNLSNFNVTVTQVQP